MLNITSYTLELIKDPFGILTGKRYEFMLDIEVDEEDELYSEKGLYVRVIYLVEENRGAIVKHEIIEKSTDRQMDFELEDDELEAVEAFCREHLAEK